jgi:hypothetical protein
LSFAQVFSTKPLALYPLVVGGVNCTAFTVASALDCLEAAKGLMIRQPLSRIGSPLARCDYHAVAAPYRSRFETLTGAGRGAAGRHIAKQAFCSALRELLAVCRELDPIAAFEAVSHRAWLAFASDFAYCEAMALAARTLAPCIPVPAPAAPELAVAV